MKVECLTSSPLDLAELGLGMRDNNTTWIMPMYTTYTIISYYAPTAEVQKSLLLRSIHILFSGASLPWPLSQVIAPFSLFIPRSLWPVAVIFPKGLKQELRLALCSVVYCLCINVTMFHVDWWVIEPIVISCYEYTSIIRNRGSWRRWAINYVMIRWSKGFNKNRLNVFSMTKMPHIHQIIVSLVFYLYLSFH